MKTGRYAGSGNFPFALTAGSRSQKIPESADVYGWLIGSWDPLDFQRDHAGVVSLHRRSA